MSAAARQDAVWRRRIACACAIAAAVVFAPPAIGLALSAGGQGTDAAGAAGVGNEVNEAAPAGAASEPAGPASGIAVDSAAWSRDPWAELGRLEDAVAATGSPPVAFVAEAGFPPGARELRADETGSVVGCTLDAGPNAAFDEVCRTLEEKGWVAVELGGATGATFVKEGGALRWMLVSCTQVGDSSCVVYQCA